MNIFIAVSALFITVCLVQLHFLWLTVRIALVSLAPHVLTLRYCNLTRSWAKPIRIDWKKWLTLTALALAYPEPNESSPRIIPLRLSFIFSSHLHSVLPSGLFPLCFSAEILYAFITSPRVLQNSFHFFSLHRNNIWWSV